MKHFKFLSLMLMATVAMFAFTACGDDDENSNDNKGGNNNNNQPSQNDSINGGSQGATDINRLIVGTWETYAVISEGGQEIAVSRTNPDVWPYWNRFVFNADGSFNGYVINYNGDAEIRGRIEHTMIAKYGFNTNAKELILKELILGYHEVKDYLAGKAVTKTTLSGKLISVTDNEFIFSANMGELGNVTMKMKKVSNSVDITDSTQPNDSINNNQDTLYVNPGTAKSIAEKLVGTWGTTRIQGWALSQDSAMVDNWDNYPNKNDASTGKTSLKYEEYVFTSDGKFERWAFNEETRTFGKTEIAGNFYVDGRVVTVVVGQMSFSITILELDDTIMVFQREAYEDEFHVGSNKIPAFVTDIISTVKLK